MKIHALVAAGALAAMCAGSAMAQSGAIRPGKIRVSAAPVSQAAAQPATPAPTAAEQAMAGNVYTGTISCDMGADVEVSVDPQNEGYFHVKAGGKSYHMRPVTSRTGATRLEDTEAGAMWLQLGNKSMLLDQKLGRRIADGCAGPAQLELAAQMEREPVNLLKLGN